jgi:three-Cys-motif partner protein
MLAKTVIDPADGSVAGEVGRWALEKHDRVRKYVVAAGTTRAKYVPPNGRASASYIELYCGAGRSLISGTSQIIDGSALVAYKAGQDSAMPFTDLHLSDLEQEKVDAAAKRIQTLGGVVQKYQGPADKTVDRVLRAINQYGLHLAFLSTLSH